MLKGNIVLPEYQRSFVWDEKDIKRLIKSFYEGQFVQPITIAQYKAGNTERNLILDGQQRLTSILLYYLGYLPDKGQFELEKTATTSDDSVDEDETTNDKANDKKIIGWTFEDLLKNTTNTIETIKEKLKDDNRYSEITKDKDKDIILDDNFLDNHFLGFSYIIPNCNTCDEINSYYSTLFRMINYYGVSLTNLECRRSLYYMNSKIKNYFEGKINDDTNVLHNIKTPGNNTNIDIIRYLSNLSLYSVLEKDNKEDEFKFNTDEKFYTDYVFHILGQETEDYDFKKFNFETTLKNNWNNSYERICDFINNNSEYYNLENPSWYEIDFLLSGLIYCNLFKGKIETHKDGRNLFDDIKAEIERNKGLRTAIDKFEEIDLREPLEQIYKKEEFKILGEIKEKEFENPKSKIVELFSQRGKCKDDLIKLNDKIKKESSSVLQKRSEIEKTIKEAHELIEEISNNKQKSIQNLSEMLPYIIEFQKLNQSYQKSKEIIGKLKEEQKGRNLTNEITYLNSKINMHIFSIAKREYKKTSTYEYVVKKSIEIYSRYVQE